ncbi:MAG: peptidyl-prolyl cis-trans isomerase [Xanthobacteraceae bacterium]
MLRGIRTASANWLGKGVMALVMGLLIVSFAIWGIGDIFRGFGRSSLAKIGRTEIGIEQFRQIYNDRLQQLGRQIGRPISPDQARALGFDQQLLGQLIAETALDERVRQLGLGLSDAEIAKRITEDPTFRGFTGQFDRGRFEQMIRSAGYSEPRYVAEQRRVSLRRQLADAISGEVAAPKAITEALSRYEGEQRTIEYVVLDRSKAGDVPAPTPEELAQYFEGRKALFRAPEYRKVALIVLSIAEALPWISVTDADAKARYDEQHARYVTPERRQVQQIVFPSADEARPAGERLAGGLDFAALAAERGLKDSDIDLGLVTKSGMVDRAVAEAAFALKEGEASQPVQGRFGTAIVRVTKIEPETVRSFEEAAPEIKRELATDRARQEIQARYNKIEDERAGGAQLAELAQKLGLKAHTIEAVDRSGRDPNGAAVQLPTGVDVINSIFSSDVGVENDPLQLPGGGYVWYDVLGVTPSRERPLEEIKDRVEARWRDDQVVERLTNKAKELTGKLAAGAAMADVAASEGVKVETASGLKRTKSASEVVSANLVEEAFKAGKGVVGVAEGQNATERIVFRVTDIGVPELDPKSAEAKRIDDALKRALSDDIMGQYILRVQNDIGVSINQAALRQAIGGGRTDAD